MKGLNLLHDKLFRKKPENDICTLAGKDDFAFKKRLKFLRSFSKIKQCMGTIFI
jgi:hypothetical protein